MKIDYKINMRRLEENINKSSSIGRLSNGGLCRLALSNQDKEMRDLYVKWLEETGLEVKVDDLGNIYGTRVGKQRDLSPVVIGSHLDTQPQGGRFDGILGVLAALEVIQTLNDYKIETKRPIKIVNFTNEEGARFEPSMMGSGGISGMFSNEFIHESSDSEGNVFAKELERIGYFGSRENRLKNGCYFVELHIEQGPILEKEGIDIGIVAGVQGIKRLNIEVEGEYAHAGTTPMLMRKDALLAASRMIMVVNKTTKKIDENAKSTIGRLTIDSASANSIPGKVLFSLDLRHEEEKIHQKLTEEIINTLEHIAQENNVHLNIKHVWDTPATPFDANIQEVIFEAAEYFGYSSRKIISGAGHDAKYVNEIIPSGMIFVPSAEGKSHCQEELTYREDIHQGANVLLYTVMKLAAK